MIRILKIAPFFFFLALGLLVCGVHKEENPEPSSWVKQGNGIWKLNIGGAANIDLLAAANVEPNFRALQQFSSGQFPLDTAQISIKEQNGKIYLSFPLDSTEQIYGLGLQFKTIHRRGKIYQLHVDHYGGLDNGRTHAPVPFYVSSKGYGVLINSARYVDIYVGTTVRRDSPNPPVVYDRNTDKNWDPLPDSDAIELLIPDDRVEVILFHGKTPMEVVQKYNLYNGGGCLPPKWGLGFTYRTHTLLSDKEVQQLVTTFEEKNFPLDFIGLEPGWMNRSYPCSYEWDEGRFPNPEGFVDHLLEKGVRTNLWMNPYVAPKAKLFDAMAPFSGSHTVWNGIVPDYTLDSARKAFSQFYQANHLDIGVSGLKIDEVDGYDFWLWPDVATFPSGVDAEQMRQIYALVFQDMITDLYHENNQRTYGLVRASNAGGTRFPFVLYNDYYKHEDFITALINSGFSGLLWTPEARSSQNGEEWLRRMQSVCFSPMAMINAWSSGTLPWSYPEVYEAVREVAQLRMQLLPYIYSSFAEYHFKGTPPIRPMPLIEGFVIPAEASNSAYAQATRSEIKDQYLFGESLLVAPVFAGQKSRKVILPKGKWYDFYTGNFIGEEEIVEVKAKLNEIPLFVKDGGIIPLTGARLHAPKKDEKLDLEVRHYGTLPGSFLLYDDDGETFDYEKGAYSWTTLDVASKNDALVGKALRVQKTIFNYGDISWKFMTK